MYRIQSHLCGVEFRGVPLREDCTFDWRGLLDAVDVNTALVFITTPANPSGWCPPVEEVKEFAAALPESCLLVADEAYIDFCRDQAAFSLLPCFDKFPNLVLLRTFQNVSEWPASVSATASCPFLLPAACAGRACLFQ